MLGALSCHKDFSSANWHKAITITCDDVLFSNGSESLVLEKAKNRFRKNTLSGGDLLIKLLTFRLDMYVDN